MQLLPHLDRPVALRVAALATLAVVASLATSSVSPLYAQDTTHVAATLSSAATPAARASAPPRWEHGVYSHWLGAAKRWSAPGGTFVEENNLNKFLTALGASPSELLPKYVSEERYNATVLSLLGRQGWELVTCQYVERSSSGLYVCYLKRPLATGPQGP